MPIQFKYDPDKNILYEKGEDKIYPNDFLKYYEELAKIGIRSGLRCIADYRTAEVNFSFDEMFLIAPNNQIIVKELTNIRVAICASNDLIYGMARMYGMINESNNFIVHVFRTFDDACSWLEIKKGDVSFIRN